jgi:hypothetical protein
VPGEHQGGRLPWESSAKAGPGAAGARGQGPRPRAAEGAAPRRAADAVRGVPGAGRFRCKHARARARAHARQQLRRPRAAPRAGLGWVDGCRVQEAHAAAAAAGCAGARGLHGSWTVDPGAGVGSAGARAGAALRRSFLGRAGTPAWRRPRGGGGGGAMGLSGAALWVRLAAGAGPWKRRARGGRPSPRAAGGGGAAGGRGWEGASPRWVGVGSWVARS